MPYIQGENREQLTLIPMCLDDYLEEENICRVIAAYVDSLDMADMGFKYARPKETGRPPYSPSSMLMLYLYGYLNRVRSSRRLEAETKRNIEVMWLMKKVTPDDKTICNFRKDNAAALKKVFREFSLWCSDKELYGKELVAVDSSKIRANSSRKNIYTQKLTEKKLADVETKITKYMDVLDKNDTEETSSEATFQPEIIREILSHLNKKKETLQERLAQIEDNNGSEISIVDPDARIMHQGGDGRSLDACYNVQSVVDEKYKLIVDFEVSTCADEKGALPEMTQRAKEIMGISKIEAVADSGYYDGGDLAECEQKGTTCYVSKMQNGTRAPEARFDRKNFKYNKESDSYVCPEGAILVFNRFRSRPKDRIDRLYSNFAACQKCEYSDKCWKNKSRRGREVWRSPNQDAMDVVDARMLTDEGRNKFRERKKIVEHPFGTTKHIWGYKQFLCRGKEKVIAEQSLAFFAYNFRRVFNIFNGAGANVIEVFT